MRKLDGGRVGPLGDHPKKVTVLAGSPHKGGATQRAARRFMEDLESFGDVNAELVELSDYDVGVCRGCKVCFEHGEERCPLKDDRDVLIEKIAASDAVVFASPNYSFQVSATMKIFLDRLGFLFHRPRFHGKAYTSIVVYGIYGGSRIVKYLDFVGGGLGFNVVKGSAVRTLEPMGDKALAKMEKTLSEQSRRFHAQLMRPAHQAPSLLQLMAFRLGRTSVKLNCGEESRDHAHYRDQGWFDSDYYYPTHLGPFKKAAGAVLDWAAVRMFRPRDAESKPPSSNGRPTGRRSGPAIPALPPTRVPEHGRAFDAPWTGPVAGGVGNR